MIETMKRVSGAKPGWTRYECAVPGEPRTIMVEKPNGHDDTIDGQTKRWCEAAVANFLQNQR